MVLLISLVISGILNILLAYGVFNLLRKTEKYEDVVADQVNYLNSISKLASESSKKLKELDTQGAFAADDEVGTFFKTLQQIQELLDTYMLPDNYGKKEEQ